MCGDCRRNALPKKNFEIAEEKNIGLVIQIKRNQDSLYCQVEHGCNIYKPIDIQEDDWQKNHGRLEKRKYELFDASLMLKKWPEWKYVKQVVRVTRWRERLSKKSEMEVEISYHGSNQVFSALKYAELIRQHWWCENKNHYVKDTAFNEDDNTKRIGAFNYCVLLSTALNIMRINKSENIRGDLYTNTMDFYKMISMVKL